MPALEDRIHNVGLTLIASLPASKRHHAVGRLANTDHERLDRVLAAAVTAFPLGINFASRVLGASADAPGIASFVEGAGRLREAATSADIRSATDLIAQSALQVGLDRFQAFLLRADEAAGQNPGRREAVPPTSAPPLGEVQLVAKGDLRCEGYPAGCSSGGTYGSTAMYRLFELNLCRSCAVKSMDLGDESGPQQSYILRRYLLQ